ncbi:MAG: alpha/beta fold hydrolase [Pseudomonadales bacterium]|nr:alpha/beta fold hydrolase [Pseudomonadales bacterium]
MMQIQGAVGSIEFIVEEPEGASSGVAVICHPHPEGGGSMHNKVVHTLARAYRDKGITACRFNYRGVGLSEGVYANGIGELEDTLAVIDFMRERYPQRPLYLAGFSFGGSVALKAASIVADRCVHLTLVAPAIGRYGVDGNEKVYCPVLLIQGDEDELIAAEDNLEWASRSGSQVKVELLAETGHFFHRKLVILKKIVEEALSLPI